MSTHIRVAEEHRDGAVDIHDLELNYETVVSRSPRPSPPRLPPRANPRTNGTNITSTNHRVPLPSEESSQEPRQHVSTRHTQSEDPLIETNEDVVFELEGADYAGNIYIKNITNENIIFKVKTTSPNGFRVNPTIGMLGTGNESSGTIRVTPEIPIIQVRKHRFQIQAAILPPDLDTSSEVDESDMRNVDYSRLNTLFKTAVERRVPMYIKTLTSSIHNNSTDGPHPTNPFHSDYATSSNISGRQITKMNMDGIHENFEKLETKISTDFRLTLEAVNKKTLIVLYILTGFVILFGILILFMIPSCGSIPPGGDPPPISGNGPSPNEPLDNPTSEIIPQSIDARWKMSCCTHS